jgi:hypothetical protein
MIGDHYDPTAARAPLLVRTVDGILDTHRFPVLMSAHRFHIIKMLSEAVDEAAPRVAGYLRD